MRAQARVRKSYVTIRLTHKQLLAIDFALAATDEDWFNNDTRRIRAYRDGAEIIGNAAVAVRCKKHGNLSRAGMLYDDRRRGP